MESTWSPPNPPGLPGVHLEYVEQGKVLPPAPGDDNDDSDDHYYPDFDFRNQPAENTETIEGQMIKSVMSNPAAPIMEPETAATGTTTSSLIVMEDVNPSPVLSPVIPSQLR